MTVHKRLHSSLFWLPVIVLLLLAFWVRSHKLNLIPLYFDEVHYIFWTQEALDGRPFLGDYRKILHQEVLSLFVPTGPEAAWLSRVVSSLCGVMTVAGTVAIVRRLGDRISGLAAGSFAALLPLTVFLDRTALADPIQTTFIALSMVVMVDLARKPTLKVALLLGLCMAAAYLAKVSSLPVFGMPLLTILILSEGSSGRKRSILMWGVSLLVAAVVIFPIYSWVVSLYSYTGLTMQTISYGTIYDLLFTDNISELDREPRIETFIDSWVCLSEDYFIWIGLYHHRGIACQ